MEQHATTQSIQHFSLHREDIGTESRGRRLRYSELAHADYGVLELSVAGAVSCRENEPQFPSFYSPRK